MAFSLCPMLTQGVVHLLIQYGSPQQRALYLAKMVPGIWTGTMDLTEPQAGSDLGAVATRAEPVSDDSWRITGQKIFITYGEHDLAENIVHLVLARAPEAPLGTKGLSCFIVPKLVPDPDGQPGRRNAVRCIAIEDKMGIHASLTCVVNFDKAVGYLVGEVNAGMSYMFTMMNMARLLVGLQGVAVAESAYQQAYAYANERIQGVPVGDSLGLGRSIIEHPDVRRSLLTMRSLIEAMRGLLYVNAEVLDRSQSGERPADQIASKELCDILTPISKAWCTDMGAKVVSMALQVHGGMGYIEETGVAQRYRDIRIASIYEGTNGIQAADLVTRKLRTRDGTAVRDLIVRMRAMESELDEVGPELGSIRRGLALATGALNEATEWMLERSPNDRGTVLAGATPYLEQWGWTLGGWVLARQALTAFSGAPDDGYLAGKLASAKFYCEQLLPIVGALGPAVTSGSQSLYEARAGDLTSV